MSAALSGGVAVVPSLGAAWGLGTLGLAAAVALLVMLRRGPAWGLQGQPLAVLVGSTMLLCVGSAVWPAAGLGDSGLTWAAWVRGISGDLSASSAVLLLAALAARLRRSPAAPSPRLPVEADGVALRLAVAGFGWALILTQLLTDRIDLYSLGYAGWALPLGCIALGALAAALGFWRSALALGAALLAWSLGLMESSNLWDALIDPWLTLWASGSLLAMGVRRVLRRGRTA